jgi:hypothetical protein
MAITTSYFANLKNVANPLCICCSPPDWYRGKSDTSLAPHPITLKAYKKGLIDTVEFTIEYQELVLDALDASDEYKRLQGKYGKDVTLVCYEKPSDFCHRRLAADWFTSELGIAVLELPNTVNMKCGHIPPTTLFRG